MKTFQQIVEANEHLRDELTEALLCCEPTAYRRNGRGDPTEPLYTEHLLLSAVRIMRRDRYRKSCGVPMAAERSL